MILQSYSWAYIWKNKTLIQEDTCIPMFTAALFTIVKTRRNSTTLRYAADTTLMAASEEDPRSLLMKMKEESGKAGLKLSIQKTKIMASSPITLQKIDGKKGGNGLRFHFLGFQNQCRWRQSHEIKRHLFLGRKAMTDPDSALKSRDIILQTKVHIVKAMFFSIGMYGCESQTIKKSRRQRIDALNCGVGEDF